MDPPRFDALTRLVATSRSRRYVLRALAAAAVGGTVASLAAAQAPPTAAPPAQTAVPVASLAPPETAVATASAETVPATVFPATAPAPATPGPAACTVVAAGGQPGFAFRASVQDLTLAGEGRTNPRGLDSQLALTVDRAGAGVVRLDAALAADGAYTLSLHYGAVVGGVGAATFTSRDGRHVEGAVDGRQLAPFTAEAPAIRFADGTPVPPPVFPPELEAALQQLPAAAKSALAGCAGATSATPVQTAVPLATLAPLETAVVTTPAEIAPATLAPPETAVATAPPATAPATLAPPETAVATGPAETAAATAAIAPGALSLLALPLAADGDPTFGGLPRYDDTAGRAECHACVAEAYAASAACGLACGFSFGLACVCAAGVPLAFANCHATGEGLGQGCCPVGCGPSQTELGIGVVFQCCYGGDACLDDATGLCCGPGYQPCAKRTCCPANAPCRDLGICCPTSQNTCVTASGPVCCNPGEDCIQGVCCASGGTICNGACCPPGKVCVDGVCRFQVGPCAGCAADCCGGVCTDINTDRSNCGACGNACAPGETCSGAFCNPA